MTFIRIRLLTVYFFLFQDCMYLHELGEEAASFTKEEMQQGWVLPLW